MTEQNCIWPHRVLGSDSDRDPVAGEGVGKHLEHESPVLQRADHSAHGFEIGELLFVDDVARTFQVHPLGLPLRKLLLQGLDNGLDGLAQLQREPLKIFLDRVRRRLELVTDDNSVQHLVRLLELNLVDGLGNEHYVILDSSGISYQDEHRSVAG